MELQFVPKSVTLNDHERPKYIAVVLRYFIEFDRLGGRLRHSG